MNEEPHFEALPAPGGMSGHLVFDTRQMDAFLDSTFDVCRAEETLEQESDRNL